MTDSAQRVRVEQVDREAAADLTAMSPYGVSKVTAEMIRDGQLDHAGFVQAFAAHRLAALASAAQPGVGAGAPSDIAVGVARCDIARGSAVTADMLKDDGTGSLVRFARAELAIDLPSIVQGAAQPSADPDETRRDAWRDFEDDYLTDGNDGYRAADVYARCRDAFNFAWDGGAEVATAAAVDALTRPAAEGSQTGWEDYEPIATIEHIRSIADRLARDGSSDEAWEVRRAADMLAGTYVPTTPQSTIATT